MLMIMGIAVAGWLLGSAGHARAATLPAPLTPVTGALGHVTNTTVGTALHDVADTTSPTLSHPLPLPLRPGGGTTPLHALGVQSPVHISIPRETGTTPPTIRSRRPATTAIGMAGTAGTPSTTPAAISVRSRHSSSAPESLRSESRITRHGVTHRAHRAHRRHTAGASGITRTAGHHGPSPRPQPHQASSAGTGFGGLHCGSRSGHVGRPPFVTALIIGAVPPAVRTAADEPSFAPD
jgi:hypothetical protein